MKKLYDKFCWLEQWIALLLLAGITVLVFTAALMRTFNHPINWAQDAALVMFALFVKKLPNTVQKAIDILFKIIILVFLFVLVVFGYQYVVGYAKRMITTLNISYAWVTASVPVGSLLMFVNTTINLIRAIKTPSVEWGDKK